MSDGDVNPRNGTGPVLVGLGMVGLIALGLLLFAIVELRRGAAQPLPVYGQVGEFTLTSQDGHTVSLADLRGHVWVADLIFTRCAGPCLKMTRQMKELQEALPANGQARLVTLTTDPDYDTPAVLKAYAQRFGADPARWTFLTGSKAAIAKLAVDSLKLTALPKSPEERQSPEDLFVHSTIFVIVDQQGRLRGVFETTGDGIEPAQVRSQILAAVRSLERES